MGLFGPKKISQKLIIRGKVQGVFFQDAAKTKALSLGLTGFARNQPDGTVYAEIEGTEQAVGDFVVWCYQGSGGAEVEKVDVQPGKKQGFKSFEVR